jgi:hypothetical protein
VGTRDHELSERYELLYRTIGFGPAGREAASPEPEALADDAGSVAVWVTGTNTTDDAIQEMSRAAAYLAEAHALMAARTVLSEVLALHLWGSRTQPLVLTWASMRLARTR